MFLKEQPKATCIRNDRRFVKMHLVRTLAELEYLGVGAGICIFNNFPKWFIPLCTDI